MSFGISSVQGARAPSAPLRATTTSKNSTAAESADSSDAVTVDVNVDQIPPSPPDEVLDAMGVAASAHDQLAANDRGLSFKIDDATGKVIVSVHDADGNLLFTVPGSKALDIASGGSLDD